MKKILIPIFLSVPLFSACTLLDVETTKTETVTATESKSEYKDLEARIEALEQRLHNLEQAQLRRAGGRGN